MAFRTATGPTGRSSQLAKLVRGVAQPGAAGQVVAQRYRFIADNVDLRRLWVGRTTSVIGDRMFAIGTVWIAWTLTHSSVGVACIILAESVPFMAWGLLQRLIRIRIDVRALVMLDLARAGILLALVSMPLTGALTKTVAVALVAAVAFSTAIFEPAFRSLIPELVSRDDGRQAYASFDLGGRLARIAGPVLAAGITWLGSPRTLIAVDVVTFLVSAACLGRMRAATRAAIAAPGRRRRSSVGNSGLRSLSQALLWANGVGTFALIVWWLALPIAASHHPHGATTYGICIAAGAAGGILANLVLSRAPDERQPIALCAGGWGATALCISALVLSPNPVMLEALSALCGAALCAAALGFSFHAASLELPVRNQLFQRDQVIMRTAGACGAVASGIALQYRPHAVILGAAVLLLGLAAWILLTSSEVRTVTRPADAAAPFPAWAGRTNSD